MERPRIVEKGGGKLEGEGEKPVAPVQILSRLALPFFLCRLGSTLPTLPLLHQLKFCALVEVIYIFMDRDTSPRSTGQF